MSYRRVGRVQANPEPPAFRHGEVSEPAVNLEPEPLPGLGSRHHADVPTIQHTELIVLLLISLMTASACETRQMSSCVPALLEP